MMRRSGRTRSRSHSRGRSSESEVDGLYRPPEGHVPREVLEARINDLLRQLAEEKQISRRERHHIATLEREIGRHKKANEMQDTLYEDLENERMLRVKAEDRLDVMKVESDGCKARLLALQDEFKHMENVVSSLLQYKSKLEQMKQEKDTITTNYKNDIQRYQTKLHSIEQENQILTSKVKVYEMQSGYRLDDFDKSKVLLERCRILEAENSQLVLENEQQRQQYEKCLDEIANQVVQALLMQKSLRAECHNLQGRVRDLEDQNRYLTSKVSEKVRYASDSMLQQNYGQPRKWRLKNTSNQSQSRNASYQSLPAQSPLPPFTRANTNQMSKSQDSIKSAPNTQKDYSTWSNDNGLYDVNGMPELSTPPPWLRDKLYALTAMNGASTSESVKSEQGLYQQVRVETEFPANNSSPKMKHVGFDARASNLHQWRRPAIDSNSSQITSHNKENISRRVSEDVPTRDEPATMPLLQGKEEPVVDNSPGKRLLNLSDSFELAYTLNDADDLPSLQSKRGCADGTLDAAETLLEKRDALKDYEAYSRILLGTNPRLPVRADVQSIVADMQKLRPGVTNQINVNTKSKDVYQNGGESVNSLNGKYACQTQTPPPSRPSSLSLAMGVKANLEDFEKYLDELDTPTPAEILSGIKYPKTVAISNTQKITNYNGYHDAFSEISPSPNNGICNSLMSQTREQNSKTANCVQNENLKMETKALHQKQNNQQEAPKSTIEIVKSKIVTPDKSDLDSPDFSVPNQQVQAADAGFKTMRTGSKDEGYSSMSSDALSEKIRGDNANETGQKQQAVPALNSQVAAKPSGPPRVLPPVVDQSFENKLENQINALQGSASSNSSIENSSIGKVKDIKAYFECEAQRQGSPLPVHDSHTMPKQKCKSKETNKTESCGNIPQYSDKHQEQGPSTTCLDAQNIEKQDQQNQDTVPNKPLKKKAIHASHDYVNIEDLPCMNKMPTSFSESCLPSSKDFNTSLQQFEDEWLDMCSMSPHSNVDNGKEAAADIANDCGDVQFDEKMASEIESKFRKEFYSMVRTHPNSGSPKSQRSNISSNNVICSPALSDRHATETGSPDEFSEISQQIEDLSRTVVDLQKSLSDLSKVDDDQESSKQPDKNKNRSCQKNGEEADFSNPEARANMLDSLIGASGSDNEMVDCFGQPMKGKQYKKGNPKVVRCHSKRRPKVSDSTFVRCGKEEENALSSFSFLQDMTSPGEKLKGATLSTTENAKQGQYMDIPQDQLNRLSAMTYIDSDADNLSLSDSCCESFSSSNMSINDTTTL